VEFASTGSGSKRLSHFLRNYAICITIGLDVYNFNTYLLQYFNVYTAVFGKSVK